MLDSDTQKTRAKAHAETQGGVSAQAELAGAGAATGGGLGAYEFPPIVEPRIRSRTFLRKYFGPLVTVMQVFADYATVVGVYLASYSFYVYFLSRQSPQTLSEFFGLSLGVGLLYVLLIDRVGLYRRETSLLNIKELRGIVRVGIYAAAVILALTFYVRSVSLSRITLTLAMLGTPFLLLLQRHLSYKIQVRFHQKGWSRRKVLIFGAGDTGKQLAQRMMASPTLGLFPVGFLDDDPSRAGESIRVKGSRRRQIQVFGGSDLLARAKAEGVDMVVIALHSASFERNQKLVELCVSHGLDYAIVPNSYEKFIQSVENFEIGGFPLLRKRDFQVSVYYLIVKRILDFALSAFFITLLSPLYLILGIAIKLDSKGPIIFKQKRVGYRGNEFSFYKFRTMYAEAPQYTQSPRSPYDERITKVGRWLRRTSLDELPQLFNVFRGDMSLVGPRPEMPFIVNNQYTSLEKMRLEAKPGITGVWQISSDRGEPIHHNLEYDFFYLINRSILLDLSIILKTMWSVIRGIGAF